MSGNRLIGPKTKMKPYEIFTEELEKIYKPVGETDWVKQNSFIFTMASINNLAIAGSIAIAVARKKAVKIPGDIDFVCDSVEQAKKFISSVENKLWDYSCYYRVLTNHKTKFCPPGCSVHFRIITPFWMPICVMVIDPAMFQWWLFCKCYNVQNFNKVVQAAKDLDARDGKKRMEAIQEEDDIRELLEVDGAPKKEEPPIDVEDEIIPEDNDYHEPETESIDLHIIPEPSSRGSLCL